MSNYTKYPRTYHVVHSPGKTDDDKTLPDYSNFEGREVVITMKMDGENTTGYWDGHIHARSLDSQNHESRNWVKSYLIPKLFNLPEGWRVCGENLFAKHSIHYQGLESFFYLFSIWNEKNECLSWDETIFWAELLEVEVVPDIYRGIFRLDYLENIIKDFDTQQNEGFVVRNTESFSYGDFGKNVAKYVRGNHVQTDQHWMHAKLVKNNLK